MYSQGHKRRGGGAVASAHAKQLYRATCTSSLADPGFACAVPLSSSSSRVSECHPYSLSLSLVAS